MVQKRFCARSRLNLKNEYDAKMVEVTFLM